ncbi:MAG TPA: hypothetical protein VFB48_05575 [Nitrososphaeraceae archaeon]|nr:hypothetical protein [Nitrososphaeraceae archaeon]
MNRRLVNGRPPGLVRYCQLTGGRSLPCQLSKKKPMNPSAALIIIPCRQ